MPDYHLFNYACAQRRELMQRNTGVEKRETLKSMSEAQGMRHRQVPRSVRAGLAYFAVVFAAGFALGTLRVLVLVPRLGDPLAAVILELPIMLALSWVACRWLVARFDVPTALVDRLVMGGLAFAVLMLAEFGVSALGFGRTLSAHLEQYRQLPALLGLVAQIAFASFPTVQAAIHARSNA
jgi:hypothetical protein